MLHRKLTNHLDLLLQQGLYRTRDVVDSSEQVINFSSNDYLSLTDEPEIKEAYQKGFKDYPCGSGGSMLISGYHPMHQALEEQFSKALGVDKCLLFSSGFSANYSVIALLASHDTPILIDKSVHASIYDGLRSSKAKYSRYRHNELSDLVHKLSRITSPGVVMTESIFSMSGQLAPLKAIADVCREKGHDLLVDEAHAFGVIGPKGLGAVAASELTQQEVPLRIIPFGKAMAGSGAIVAGQSMFINALIQSARPVIYSTAISPAMAYGLMETLKFVIKAEQRRAALSRLVVYFKSKAKQSGLRWRDSSTPIQQLQLGCPHLALSCAKQLREQSIICFPIRQPTVSKQETGLRVILNYNHKKEHIDYLFSFLTQTEGLFS